MEDAELVNDARAGSAAAFTNIFDRHAGRVHDFALAALRDRELALEVVDATFTTASQRLHGLDDPNRLGVWLLAIARHESALRAGPVAGPDRQPTLPSGDPERAALAGLVWEGVAGLPLRDRAQLDLDLRQGLDGQDLADALGVSLTQAYELQSRMRDRTEKALSGFVIARTGVERSPALQKELKGWDGQLTAPVAKRIAKIVDNDRACNQLRFTLPSVFALYASALPAPFPAVVRSRVLDRLYLPVPGADGVVTLPPGAEPWLPTGFPPPSFVVTDEKEGNKGLIFAIAAVLLAMLLIGGLLFYLVGSNRGINVATRSTSTTLPLSLGGSTSSSTSTTFTTGDTTPLPTTVAPPTATTLPSIVIPGVTTTTTTAAPAQPAAVTAPGVVDFADNSSDQPAVLKNTGGAAATFTTRTGGASISVNPPSGTIPAGGQVTVNIHINRDGLPEGTGTSQVAFDTNVGTKTTTLKWLEKKPVNITTSVVLVPGQQSPTTCNSQWQIQAQVSAQSAINDSATVLNIYGSNHKLTLTAQSGNTKTYLSEKFSPTPDAVPYQVTSADQWGSTGTVTGTVPKGC